ncbi:hypothetical protein JCM1841_000082 [Sporobolomyces salmonicolor]
MLTRSVPNACRCASTSTARPCHHAQQYARSTPSASAPAPSAEPARSSPSFDQSSSLWPNRNQKWFDSVRPGWAGWIAQDRVKPSTSSSSALLSLSYPPTRRPSTPPTPSQQRHVPSEPLDDTAVNRISAYMTFRGPRAALSQFEDEYGELLDMAEKGDMPFLKAMVMEDMEVAKMSSNERNKLQMERFAAPRLDEKKQMFATKGFGEMIDPEGKAEVPEETVGPRRRPAEGQEGEAVSVTPLGEEAVEPTDAERLSRRLAVGFLRQVVASGSRDEPLPPDLASATPFAAHDEARLRLVWTAFLSEADLDNSIDDFRFALSFLHYLAAPSSPSRHLTTTPTAPYLPLALEVFETLVDVLPEELVASEPTPPLSLPHDASLQLVLLRTIANAALSEDLLALACRTLLSLDAVRTLHPSLSSSSDADVDIDLLTSTLSSILADLSHERKSAYRPVSLPSASSSPDSLLSLAHSLLCLFGKWIPQAYTDTDQPVLPAPIRVALSSFAEEAAARYRWDAIADVWRVWSEKGWELEKSHLKFARWLAGEAPYSTYALSPAEDSAGKRTSERPRRSVRAVQTDLFARFAEATHVQLRRRTIGSHWTSDDKFEWIELLCASKASTGATRSFARRICTFWSDQAPLGTPSPFVPRGRAFLNLARTALPPYGTDPDFVRKLAASFIASLIHPSSPYAVKDGKIDHYDLTTLAQVYTMLGDHDSVAQVYRRLLAQKILPDQADVTTILTAAPKRHAESALSFVKQAGEVGLRISYEVIEGVLRSVLEDELKTRQDSEGEQPRRADLRLQNKVNSMYQLAEDLGLGAEDVARLRYVAATFLPLTSPSSTARLPVGPLLDLLVSPTTGAINPTVTLALLRKSKSAHDWGLAVKVFLRATETSSPAAPAPLHTDRLLRLTLDALLASHARLKSPSREQIRQALVSVIDRSLVPSPPLIASRATLDLCLRAMLKVGDVDAVDRLMEVLRGAGVSVKPSEDVKTTVGRWARGLLGKEAVDEREGWVADAARACVGAQARR